MLIEEICVIHFEKISDLEEFYVTTVLLILIVAVIIMVGG